MRAATVNYDHLEALAIVWWLAMLLILGFLWLCTAIPQRGSKPSDLRAPRNCRVVRGDEWVVGEAAPRFGGRS